jgi:hypothetical protein
MYEDFGTFFEAFFLFFKFLFIFRLYYFLILWIFGHMHLWTTQVKLIQP